MKDFNLSIYSAKVWATVNEKPKTEASWFLRIWRFSMKSRETLFFAFSRKIAVGAVGGSGYRRFGWRLRFAEKTVFW
jgi:hypothetical protein